MARRRAGPALRRALARSLLRVVLAAVALVPGGAALGADGSDTPLAVRVPIERASNLFAQLQALAAASGARIIVSDGATTLEGIAARADPAQALPLREALDRVLAGSGFDWREGPGGSILIGPAAKATGQFALDPLHVRDSPLDDASTAVGELDRFDTALSRGAATRLDRDTLDARAVLRFDDILRRAVNISGRGSAFSIRGIERGSDAAATSNIRLDGIPLGGRALDAGAFALDDLDSITYQRGPRSVWDGFDALAGAIVLKTRDPAPDPERGAVLAGDSDGGGHARVAYGGETGLTGLTARAAVDTRRDAGFNRNVVLDADRIDRKRETSLLARLLFEPDAMPTLAARATVLHVASDPGQPALRPPGGNAASFDPFDRESYDPNDYQADLGVDGLALAAQWQPVPAHSFELRGVLARTTQEVRTGLSTSRTDFVDQLDRERLGQAELRYAFAFAHDWHLLLGAEFQRKNVVASATSSIDLRSFFPPNAVLTIAPETRQLSGSTLASETKGSSVILALQYEHGPWSATAGLRALIESRSDARTTSTRLSEDGCTLTIGSTQRTCSAEFPDFARRTTLGASNRVVVPDLALGFAPAATQRFGLSYRSGFLGGGARTNLATGEPLAYGPEHSDNLELSYDGSWLDAALTAHVSVFYDRWRDRQVPLALLQFGNSVIVNAGRARAYGGEVELRWQPAPRWTVWSGVGRLETRYDRFPFAVTTGTVDLAGNVFPGAPRLTVDAGFGYGDATGAYASANFWYSAAAFSDPTNAVAGRRPPYAVIDLRCGYRARGFDGFVYLANAADRNYIERERVAGIDPTPREFEPGRPRQVGIGLAYKF